MLFSWSLCVHTSVHDKFKVGFMLLKFFQSYCMGIFGLGIQSSYICCSINGMVFYGPSKKTNHLWKAKNKAFFLQNMFDHWLSVLRILTGILSFMIKFNLPFGSTSKLNLASSHIICRNCPSFMHFSKGKVTSFRNSFPLCSPHKFFNMYFQIFLLAFIDFLKFWKVLCWIFNILSQIDVF